MEIDAVSVNKMSRWLDVFAKHRYCSLNMTFLTSTNLKELALFTPVRKPSVALLTPIWNAPVALFIPIWKAPGVLLTVYPSERFLRYYLHPSERLLWDYLHPSERLLWHRLVEPHPDLWHHAGQTEILPQHSTRIIWNKDQDSSHISSLPPGIRRLNGWKCCLRTSFLRFNLDQLTTVRPETGKLSFGDQRRV